ncbi:MAG: peptidoglycan-associated lipoprotein Pal [Methyloligellaceae bacterium]
MPVISMWNKIVTVCSLLLLSGGLVACSNQLSKSSSDVAGNGLSGPVVPGTARDFKVNVGDIVYFTTDSPQLTAQAQNTLRGQIKWLRQYPKFTITLEGHADERGTREYNLALGARRAQAVRNFLISQGINPSRMRNISYGKERPVALCNDISCWSQNRRVQTKLNIRPGT